MPPIREAQSYFLAFVSDRAAAAGKLVTATLQRASLLQDLVLSTDVDFGLVTDIKVAGQSISCSDSGADINQWHPAAQVEGHRGFGIRMPQRQVVSVSATLDSAGELAAALGCDPLEDLDDVDDISDGGDLANYYFGLNTVAIPAASSAVLSSEARRNVVLGLAGLTGSVAGGGDVMSLEVTSFKINNLELLNADAATGVPIEALSWFSTDIDGRMVNFPVEANDNIDITIANTDPANAADVWGGSYLLPRGAMGL